MSTRLRSPAAVSSECDSFLPVVKAAMELLVRLARPAPEVLTDSHAGISIRTASPILTKTLMAMV